MNMVNFNMLTLIFLFCLGGVHASTTFDYTDDVTTGESSTGNIILTTETQVESDEQQVAHSNYAPSIVEEETTEKEQVTTEPHEDYPLSFAIIAAIAGGAVLTCIVLAVIFILVMRNCRKEPKPLYDPDNFESFRLMRSSANLLAISEPPRPIEGRARPRAGSLQLSQPPDDAKIHDFQYSVMETCRQINGLEKQLGCLPEYLELIEGPDGVYLELTVEYDIKPADENYIPYADRLEEQLNQSNLKNKK